MKKLVQAPIICFRVGGSFSHNSDTTFLLGPGDMHVEYHVASTPRCRGAGDQRCVVMITWGGSPTCILHLHLMDRLSNGTPSHGYPRAPCAIPAIKMEKGQKINEKWRRSRTEPKGNHLKEVSWRVDPLSATIICELRYLLTWSCLPSAFTPHLLLSLAISDSWSNLWFLYSFILS